MAATHMSSDLLAQRWLSARSERRSNVYRLTTDVFLARFVPARGNYEEPEMPREIPVAASGSDAVHARMTSKIFTDDFYAVALFSGIGLLITVVAIVSGVQGEWF